MELVQVGWANHCTQMALLRAVFLYLDTAYVRSTPGTQPLWYVLQARSRSLPPFPTVGFPLRYQGDGRRALSRALAVHG